MTAERTDTALARRAEDEQPWEFDDVSIGSAPTGHNSTLTINGVSDTLHIDVEAFVAFEVREAFEAFDRSLAISHAAGYSGRAAIVDITVHGDGWRRCALGTPDACEMHRLIDGTFDADRVAAIMGDFNAHMRGVLAGATIAAAEAVRNATIVEIPRNRAERRAAARLARYGGALQTVRIPQNSRKRDRHER